MLYASAKPTSCNDLAFTFDDIINASLSWCLCHPPRSFTFRLHLRALGYRRSWPWVGHHPPSGRESPSWWRPLPPPRRACPQRSRNGAAKSRPSSRLRCRVVLEPDRAGGRRRSGLGGSSAHLGVAQGTSNSKYGIRGCAIG